MTELVETGVEAPEQGAAQPEAKAAPAEVKVVTEEEQRARDEAELDRKLKSVFREAKKDRDQDSGQYANKDKKAKVPNADEVGSEKAPSADKDKAQKESAETAEKKDQKPETGDEPDTAKAEKPAEKAIAQPKSWSADKKAVWESLSPEAKEYVSKREQDVHKGLSQLGEYAKRMEPLGSLLEQHRDAFQSKNLSYEQGLSQLLTAQRMLDQNPAAAIAEIARAYNVDLGQLADGDADQQSPILAQLQNQVSQLTRQLQDVQSGVRGRAQAEAQQRLGTIEAAIEKFASGRTDFDELAPEIELLLPALRQANPNAPFEQIISDAYEKASWSNPEARQRRLNADAAAKEKARVEAAKKAAEDATTAGRINVGSQPSANSAGNLDDELRAIVRRNRAA